MSLSERRGGPKRWLVGSAIAVLALAAVGALVWSGVLWPGRLFAGGYETRGVDVSSYQGEIDWEVLSGEGIDFAYIKATEGSSYVDERFADNWRGAQGTDLLVGAYHFMSFESSGERQAEHVISTVPAGADLPVAVDVEFYGDYFASPPSRAEVDAILGPLLERLEQHYGVAPVIYATPEAYGRYISGQYADSPIWIRSVLAPPHLDDDRDWAFWQYSHRDRLRGYDGEERYIDMNVFAGDLEELRGLGGE